jgi:hypothetical protein
MSEPEIQIILFFNKSKSKLKQTYDRPASRGGIPCPGFINI